jgi:hypothetical protein
MNDDKGLEGGGVERRRERGRGERGGEERAEGVRRGGERGRGERRRRGGGMTGEALTEKV